MKKTNDTLKKAIKKCFSCDVDSFIGIDKIQLTKLKAIVNYIRLKRAANKRNPNSIITLNNIALHEFDEEDLYRIIMSKSYKLVIKDAKYGELEIHQSIKYRNVILSLPNSEDDINIRTVGINELNKRIASAKEYFFIKYGVQLNCAEATLGLIEVAYTVLTDAIIPYTVRQLLVVCFSRNPIVEPSDSYNLFVQPENVIEDFTSLASESIFAPKMTVVAYSKTGKAMNNNQADSNIALTDDYVYRLELTVKKATNIKKAFKTNRLSELTDSAVISFFSDTLESAINEYIRLYTCSIEYAEQIRSDIIHNTASKNTLNQITSAFLSSEEGNRLRDVIDITPFFDLAAIDNGDYSNFARDKKSLLRSALQTSPHKNGIERNLLIRFDSFEFERIAVDMRSAVNNAYTYGLGSDQLPRLNAPSIRRHHIAFGDYGNIDIEDYPFAAKLIVDKELGTEKCYNLGVTISTVPDTIAYFYYLATQKKFILPIEAIHISPKSNDNDEPEKRKVSKYVLTADYVIRNRLVIWKSGKRLSDLPALLIKNAPQNLAKKRID